MNRKPYWCANPRCANLNGVDAHLSDTEARNERLRGTLQCALCRHTLVKAKPAELRRYLAALPVASADGAQ